MHEEHGDMQDTIEAREHRVDDEYVAPALTDLGSFEDLTQLQVSGPNLDSEGFST